MLHIVPAPRAAKTVPLVFVWEPIVFFKTSNLKVRVIES